MPKSGLLPLIFAFLVLSIFGLHCIKTLTITWKPLINKVIQSVNMNKGISLLRNQNKFYFSY